MKKEIVDYLLSKKTIRTFEPGEIIFCQGDAATEFYYFVSGLSLTKTLFEDGRERNILITWPGRIFGASSFFEKSVRRASAITIKHCEVIAVDDELYQLCCERFPEFREELIREISKDLGVLFDELADTSLIRSDIRVARFLCRRLANGQHIGTDERMSVSKALSKMSEHGWLKTNYGKIIIYDPAALRKYAYGE